MTVPATSSIGTFGIDAVLIEQIDAIGPQALQRGVGDLSDVLRPAVHAELRRARRPNVWPNLVAITTWSRNGASASPTISSFL